MIRVLLVDDQELVRGGLKRILRAKAGFDVVGECEDGDGVVAAVDACGPDVVVMDLRMKRVDGVEATRRVRERDGAPPVLVLTTFDDDALLSGALRAGAAGFLLKDAPGEDVLRAVRTVAEGGAWLDPSVTERVLQTYRRAAPSTRRETPAELTPRELDVLRLIGRGATNAEIAEQLVVTEVTVKSHINRIFSKLGVRDRAGAIVYAFDTGVVTPQG